MDCWVCAQEKVGGAKCHKHTESTAERICLWPNGDFCYEDELEENLVYRSDDFQYVPLQFLEQE